GGDAPKTEIEVRAEPEQGAAPVHDDEPEPAFDALAELAAMKLGAPLASLAIEVASVAEAAAAPRDATRQTARVVQANKFG
uniref:hypothetical protein n=1 Tax=Escherichia coli TaxID=562 RepID=UPI00137AB9DA